MLGPYNGLDLRLRASGVGDGDGSNQINSQSTTVKGVHVNSRTAVGILDCVI